MAVRTSAGTLLKVCATLPTTYDSTGYAALTWVTVGEVTDFGDLGREYTLVTHNPVGNRSTQKLKGSFNEGKMQLKLGLDTKDAGQVLMKAAVLVDTPYAFQVITQNGDKYYFPGLVLTWKVLVGSVNKITEASCDLELTTSSGGVGVVEALAP